MRGIILFAGLAIALALPAKADWQYAKWGMTPDEVIAAAQGQAKPDKGGKDDRVWEQDRLVSASFGENGIAFHTEFYFDKAGKLVIVRVSAVDPQNCGAYQRAIETVYGPPLQAHDGSPSPNAVMFSEYWRDVAHGNTVRFSHAAVGTFDVCFVAYMPYDRTDDQGRPTF